MFSKPYFGYYNRKRLSTPISYVDNALRVTLSAKLRAIPVNYAHGIDLLWLVWYIFLAL